MWVRRGERMWILGSAPRHSREVGLGGADAISSRTSSPGDADAGIRGPRSQEPCLFRPPPPQYPTCSSCWSPVPFEPQPCALGTGSGRRTAERGRGRPVGRTEKLGKPRFRAVFKENRSCHLWVVATRDKHCTEISRQTSSWLAAESSVWGCPDVG